MENSASYMYTKIEQAIIFIEQHKTRVITPADIASHVNISEFHFHRLFATWAGTTPERFFKYLKKEYIIATLRNSSLTQATYQAGLSNPSRLYDLCVTYEAMTPGEFKNKGKNLKIYYGFQETPFGISFLAATDRGILELWFVTESDRMYVDTLQQRFELSLLKEDGKRTESIVNKIFNADTKDKKKPFHLLLQGTNFQIKVWEALLNLPFGTVTSYEKIAAYIGKPSSARAVGNAIAQNCIAYLIPCHRVIQKVGKTGHYRWGKYRKKMILGWEFARKDDG